MITELYIVYAIVGVYLLRKIQVRLRLSMAKHPSLAGHSKMSRRIAKLVPSYQIEDEHFFSADKAPKEIAEKRKLGFNTLSQYF